MKYKINKILVGLFAVAVGASMVGDVFGLWENEVFGIVWAIALIAASAISAIFTRANIINVSALCVGVIWFVKRQTFFTLTWKEMWALAIAVVIIALGIYLILKNVNLNLNFKKKGKNQSDVVEEAPEDRNCLNDSERFPIYSAVFSESSHLNNCIGFGGGVGISVFGKLTADLTPAVLNGDVSFRVFSVFGNTHVFAPMGVRVSANGFSLFGDCENSAELISDTKIPMIKIKYFNLFGKTNIKMR